MWLPRPTPGHLTTNDLSLQHLCIFSEVSLVGLVLDLVDYQLSFSAVTLLVGHLTHKIIPKMTYIMSRGTLNPTISYQL